MISDTDTVAKIMQAATEAFAEAGFAGTRMENVAKRAGVNKATIYYNIGNKEKLYAEVLLSVFNANINRVESVLKDVSSPKDKLRIFIKNFAEAIENTPHIARIVMWEHASGGKFFPEEVKTEIARMIGALLSVLEAGEAEGMFRKVTHMLIQFMVVGCIMFYKTSAPIRTGFSAFPEKAKQLPEGVTGPIADELTEMVLRAIEKR